MSETNITLDSRDEALLLLGSRDQFLKEIRDALGVRLIARGDTIQVRGDDGKVEQAERVFQQLRQMLRQQGKISPEDVRTVIEVIQHGGDRLNVAPNGGAGGGGEFGSRFVRPRTDGQGRYVKAMYEHDLTLCVGPAGTGKTYLA